MLDRRAFTFGSLVALISQSAAAAPAPQPPQQTVGGGSSLVPVYAVRRKGGELEIDLTLRNDGDQPVDVLVALGSRPGARLTAIANGAPLEEVVDLGRRDLMSRIGPLPRYEPLAAGGSLPLGTYRFTWLASRPDAAIDVTADIQTGEAFLSLPSQRLHFGRSGV